MFQREGMVERVVIVQDASTCIRVEPVRWALDNLPLKQGDMIRLLRVVQPFIAHGPPSLISSCGILCLAKPSSFYDDENSNCSRTNLVTQGK